MYSVADEKEARALLVRACETNYRGEWVARELVEQQTLDNLERFSDRLDVAHEGMKASGQCRCAGRND